MKTKNLSKPQSKRNEAGQIDKSGRFGEEVAFAPMSYACR